MSDPPGGSGDPGGLEAAVYRPLVQRALEEDLGLAGDVTSAALIPAAQIIEARLSARQAGRIAGLPAAMEVFRLLSPEITLRLVQDEGAEVAAGATIAEVKGPARAILTGERTALNILTRLSGIATATGQAVAAIAPHRTRVACTRKTTPGLRALEKYAVRVGGGINHRFGLFDGVLIKDNHIAVAGGIATAIARARGALGHMMKIEIEVDTLAQLAQAMEAGADAVLLDNMSPDQVREAVALVDGAMVTEASGGLRPDNLRDYAAAGVDIVSLGWLTHSVESLDLGLDL